MFLVVFLVLSVCGLQVETGMEELMNCPRPGSLMGQQQQQPSRGVWEEDVALALESGSLWVEEFAVDELLNLEFMEEEKEGGEQEGEVRDFADHKKAEDLDSNTSSCSASSATSSPSFEPAVALTGIGLPVSRPVPLSPRMGRNEGD